MVTTTKKSKAKLSYSWEDQLRQTHFPQSIKELGAIISRLESNNPKDHNLGPVQQINSRVNEMLDELNDPGLNHDGHMLACMQSILQVEPYISPDASSSKLRPKAKADDDYTSSMRDYFKQVEAVTWDIYSRLNGTDTSTTPGGNDAASQILDYIVDIRKCVRDMLPLVRIHVKSKSPGGPGFGHERKRK